jgi:uncharacterized protein VirK/YbjX
MKKLVKTLIKTAPLIDPGYKPKTLWNHTKHVVRGLASARATKAWFQILQKPELAVLIGNHPGIFQKLQRPYLNRSFKTGQTLAALQQHYHFVATNFSESVRQEIFTTPGKLLATLPVPDVGNFGLRLSDSRLEKEGDLVVSLVNLADGAVLFTLVFTITRSVGEAKEIFIGGLQGNKLANDKDAIVAMTRSWHGLRPKALLLFTVQELGRIWDITHLRAVSDAMHIYRHWRKQKQVASSYDEWWVDSGGQRATDGNFDLPARFVPREISKIKVNKRQLYRRRYEMLTALAEAIQHSWLGLKPAPVTRPSPPPDVPK